MSMQYIRNYYGVPAKRGMRVVADGKPGVITGTIAASLRIRLDGEKHSAPWHPTWRIEYPDTRPMSARPCSYRGGRLVETVKVPGVSR
ncbi:hypothetical protein [Polymorphospora lycopeni]|uniref:Uncharacterized protein n=1 Tax=Polymorphospora lycopeni TaxID=3140240 RepID=A0ABV5CKQ4_9ACTN